MSEALGQKTSKSLLNANEMRITSLRGKMKIKMKTMKCFEMMMMMLDC